MSSDARPSGVAGIGFHAQPGVRLGLAEFDADGEAERIRDVDCGRYDPRCTSDRSDRDQHPLNILDSDTDLAARL